MDNMILSPEIFTGLPNKSQEQFVFYHKEEKHIVITRIVSVKLDVPMYLLNSNIRDRPVVNTRQIAMYLIKKHTKLSLTAIGKFFNRDHSTVIYSIETVNDLLDTDKKYKEQINQIEQLIK